MLSPWNKPQRSFSHISLRKLKPNHSLFFFFCMKDFLLYEEKNKTKWNDMIERKLYSFLYRTILLSQFHQPMTWKICHMSYVHQTDQNLEPPLSQNLTVQVKREPQSRYSSYLNNAHKRLSADTVCQEWVMAVSWIGHESSVCVMRKDNTILPLNTLQDNFMPGSYHDKETQWFMTQTCSSM